METQNAPKKLWAVEVERKTTVYVLAESRASAEQLAEHDYEIRNELSNVPVDAWASEVDAVDQIDAEDDSLLYGAGRDITVAEWRESGGDIDAYYTKKAAEADAARVAWLASCPTDVRGLPAWHVARPEGIRFSTNGYRDPWACNLSDGRAMASDGVAMLVVDNATAPPCALDGWDKPGHADRMVGRVLEIATPHAGTVSAAKVSEWAGARDETANVSIGPAVIRARLVEAWVLSALPVDGLVTVRWGDELDPVRFEGDGWIAIVMPRRADGEGRGPELEVTL